MGVATGEDRTAVYWEEPMAEDDSGQATLRLRSHQPGDIFNIGSMANVRYTFTDSSGNDVVCRFEVAVVEGKNILSVHHNKNNNNNIITNNNNNRN